MNDKQDAFASLKTINNTDNISESERKTLLSSGINVDSDQHSSTMLIRNDQPVYLQSTTRDYKILPLSIAMEIYPWIREKYYFKAVQTTEDPLVEKASHEIEPLGFFIHVKKGAKVKLPCQIGMMMTEEGFTQVLHNIIILEEDAKLTVLTGCLSNHSIRKGHHFAIEEHYIGKNATLTTNMIHTWGPEMIVTPHTGTIVGENGRYENNYVSMQPAKEITTNPLTYLVGKNASAKYLTVVLGHPGSTIRTGGAVYLNAEDTSAELLHRGVSTGGTIYQGGLLVGNAKCKAHVDCAGMVLDGRDGGFIESVPGLQSHNADARMSHEASIGKISPEQVEYLMSRKMTEKDAISMLIRGFIGSDIENLSPEIDEQIAKIAEIAGHGEE